MESSKTPRGKCSNICAVRFCKSTSHTPGISLFRFPKDTARCNQWVKLCGCEYLEKSVKCLYASMYRVCHLHFEKEMYSVSGKTKVRRLVGNSMPILDVPLMGFTSTLTTGIFNPDEVERTVETLSAATTTNIATPLLKSPQVGTQTPKHLISISPRKQKLRVKVHTLQSKVTRLNRKLESQREVLLPINTVTLEDFRKLCDKFLPSKCSRFVQLQASLHNKTPHQRRYPAAFLKSCLKLYFMIPKAYRNMSDLFILPSKRMLNRTTENVHFKPGFNDVVFQAFKEKVNHFLDIDKNCTICFDEMSIKSHLFYSIGKDEVVGFDDCGEGKTFRPSQNVLVLMVKGIYNKWKQPLSYFFVHNTCNPHVLKSIIEGAIMKLKLIGLKVRAVMSDMGASNIAVSNLLHITEDNPTFKINNEEIVYLFDTPHLIKAIRNNLLKSKFCYNGQCTSWEYISDFYNRDKQLSNRLAPKLTDAHINPSNMEKMKVNLAVQVLSGTVVAAMSTYVALNQMSAKATTTIEFIERFDKLFDILNSSSTNRAKEYNRAFKGLDYQRNFLNETIHFLNNVKVLDRNNKNITQKVKSIHCFKITIKGILLLWDKLRLDGFEYLFTRRLCQDSLENYFGAVRQQSGNAVNPTPIQFQRAFKKLFTLDFFNSNFQNCSQDSDEILNLNIENLEQYEDDNLTVIDTADIKISLKDCDYHFHDVESNSVQYICGYLIKKCLNVHSCDLCVRYANEHDLDEKSMYCHFRRYETKDLRLFVTYHHVY